MKILFEFLRDNPVIGLILVILLVCIFFFLMKKIFKIGLILLLIFLVASGVLFRISHLEVAKKGQELLRSAETKVTRKVRQYLPGFDSVRTDTVTRKHAPKKNRSRPPTRK
jgi:hypothetical protein